MIFITGQPPLSLTHYKSKNQEIWNLQQSPKLLSEKKNSAAANCRSILTTTLPSGIRTPKRCSRREFLGLYLIGNPKDKFELDYNEEIMPKAGASVPPVNWLSSTREFGSSTVPRSRRTSLNISREGWLPGEKNHWIITPVLGLNSSANSLAFSLTYLPQRADFILCVLT